MNMIALVNFGVWLHIHSFSLTQDALVDLNDLPDNVSALETSSPGHGRRCLRLPTTLSFVILSF
jgi:hypothetical protein